ncbi:hypothetical protein KDW_54310 [Dictyobacter vulcani]|uniref:Rieske domain-containing protein n=1 Tax=Dictyobacter vulcani TaxID=2607529 RepID=A0A5J4KYP5_9CHLR|nr:Rieske 2Fe-2S domain-containing protein [Dictyobacter vulcani]GER91269.1 hypothetical protein KDW_54310 [Dictyobacter vulcani]
MAGEDQERLEDYLALENYIEALRAGKVVHPPANLTLEQARIYQMAILFHAATHDDAEPRPEFVDDLQSQILAMSTQPQVPQPESSDLSRQSPVPVDNTIAASRKAGTPQPVQFVSRRRILTGGAIAAASLVIGTGIGAGIESHNQPAAAPPPPLPGNTDQRLQMAEGTPTRWHFVTTLADLGTTAVRFTSDAIVGYVLRTTDARAADNPEHVIALSAACTHKGCLVQWKNTERHFLCPCHGAIFDALGTQKTTDYAYTLPPLPDLNTKIEDGKIYVEVPR